MFVHPVLRRLPPTPHLQVERGLLRTFGRVMPVGMTLCVVLAIPGHRDPRYTIGDAQPLCARSIRSTVKLRVWRYSTQARPGSRRWVDSSG